MTVLSIPTDAFMSVSLWTNFDGATESQQSKMQSWNFMDAVEIKMKDELEDGCGSTPGSACCVEGDHLNDSAHVRDSVLKTTFVFFPLSVYFNNVTFFSSLTWTCFIQTTQRVEVTISSWMLIQGQRHGTVCNGWLGNMLCEIYCFSSGL